MQKIFDYLDANEARFVSELGEYVCFPSVSAQLQHKPDLEACARWLAERCQRIGLITEICPTPGNPILLAKTPRAAGSKKPHFVVYGHYDVQPPEPLNLWKTPPFKPTIQGKSLFARGASDNKGQHLAHLNAIEAYLKTGHELPCDITFLIEGEEEVGCANLPPFLKARRSELRCEAVVVSDTGMPDKKHPALTYALRGIAALEIKLTGPSRDLHSGIYGGSLKNPALALCQLLAQIQDKNGRVTIPNFYDEVAALTAYERKQFGRLPFQETKYRKFLGVPALFGEKGFTPDEQRTARPTFEINGLTSGYQGEGSKTIVPSWASAKITMRLVPNQQPGKIIQKACQYLKKICPPGVKISIASGHGGEPYLVSPDGPLAQAALAALRGAFGCEPVIMREGGSIPIVTQFKKILGAETLLLGLGLPDDNPHSPNEKFDLECYAKGMRMSAGLWPELAKATANG
jgi:acetylornithine deacetylase/succinyl-diaminopimelate desuccinylase-like protein